MLIGYPPPAVTGIAIAGATWLTADGGAACYDGKPARKARLSVSTTPAITLTYAAAFIPRVIAVLGLVGVAVGSTITATTGAGGALGGNSATATAVKFADGSIGAWIVTGNTVSTATVKITIGATGTIDIGEIAAKPAVSLPIMDGWQVATIDPSVSSRTRGAQLNTVAQSAYRSLSATLAPMGIAATRNGGLDNGMDLSKLAVALRGGARCCAIPHYLDIDTRVLDPAMVNATAIYGVAVTLPDPANVQRQWSGAQIVVEEVPA